MDEQSPSSDVADDLVLRAWEDDESVQGELLLRYGGTLERTIARRFSRLSATEVEDIVAEAIKRFWEWRHNYDGQRSLQACLFRMANHVALELVSGRLKWQKSRNLERQFDDPEFSRTKESIEPRLDELESRHPQICQELRQVVDQLPEIQQDIIWAYAVADTFELDAAHLGRELGKKYKNGIPIPAGTIRQYKKRATDTIIKEMKTRGYDLERLGVRQ